MNMDLLFLGLVAIAGLIFLRKISMLLQQIRWGQFFHRSSSNYPSREDEQRAMVKDRFKSRF